MTHRHNSAMSESGRLARRSALLRRVESELARVGNASEAVAAAREASKLEVRALQLAGYPVDSRGAWDPSEYMTRLPAAAKLVGVSL